MRAETRKQKEKEKKKKLKGEKDISKKSIKKS